MYEASSDVWSSISGMENGEYLLPGALSHAYRRSCVAFNVNGVVLSIFFL